MKDDDNQENDEDRRIIVLVVFLIVSISLFSSYRPLGPLFIYLIDLF